MGRHDQDDEDDEMMKRDGYVGWMPSKPEPGKHAAEDQGQDPVDEDDE
ncbi:MAG: hypothetical protein ACRDTG_01845 [Pseudonocardiaceae bacterium]